MESVRVDHYILGKTIGTGGFAKVKEATHDLTGLRVAIKIINKRKMKNEGHIAKVKREIKILKLLHHQNIIKIYEVIDTTNDLLVILQLAQGGDLSDYVDDNNPSEEQIVLLFRQIILGIQYAHSRLISHRDLKLENILVDSNKIVKIIDFGLSNFMDDGDMLSTSCGSPYYAPPEIVGERKYQGTSVDVWSCGVILFRLLTGQLPFQEESINKTYYKIEQGKYVMPPNINPVAADLIHNMLQVDPCQRLRIYQIKNHPWMRPFIAPFYLIPLTKQNSNNQIFDFDEEIFGQIKKFPYNTIHEDHNDQKMKKAIKAKSKESFVTTYELLTTNKHKNERAQRYIHQLQETKSPNAIIRQIENIIIHKGPQAEHQYQFGKRFNKPARILVETVMRSLKKLYVKYTINKDQKYCIECQFTHEPIDLILQPQPSQQSDEQRKLRYSKRQIKFTIHIYCVNSKKYEHVLDLKLRQGHPLVFIDVARKIFTTIQTITI